MRFSIASSAACVIAAAGIATAHAQSTAASGSVVVVPVVAQTASYTTEVIVRNPNASPITLNVKFYEANNSATPGLRSCSQLVVAANTSTPFTLGGVSPQCTLTNASHFGMLVLEDATAPQTHQFFAYSRAQTPGGNGFSVEGFPIGAFSAEDADVDGLKRQAASPTYQSNCFVGALSEAVSYQVLLLDSGNNLVGLPLSGTLQPFEMLRYLDVFAKAGAPAGDHANVRANFTVTGGDAPLDGKRPALVGLCTVQESTFFGADFRVAKSQDALNEGQKRVACIGQDQCGVTHGVSVSQPEQITNATLRNVYSMIITQPDHVRCDVVAAPADLPNLQMRLRLPGDPFSSTVFAGGAGQTSFSIFTGGRNAIDNGTATRWFIDVETINSATTVPSSFGVTCSSGNGTEVPWFRGTAARF